MPGSDRRYVELPVVDADALRATAADRGVPVSTVIYMILTRGAAAAAAGRGEHLPQVSPSRRPTRGSVGELVELRWTQGLAEYRDCIRQLESAGSSLTAAIRAGAQAYVAAGGDPVRMAWPFLTAAVAAA